MIFFFFSSRRRHTRFDCDWSSDVCSSDLKMSRVTRGAIEDEEPARGSVGQRMLGDLLRGEIVVEIREAVHQRAKILACSAGFWGTKPKGRYAPGVGIRPPGVRARHPSCITNV